MRCAVLSTAGLILGLTIGAGSTVSGQSGASGMSPERLERVAAAIDKHVATGELAGAVSLIYRHGEIAAVSAHGFQDLAARRPMQRDTIFGLASMTKPVTAVAAMILVEEGKIRLDEPVDRWLPELADRKVLNDPSGPLDEVHDSPRPITLRDLLTYTMGLGSMNYAGIAATTPIAQAFATVRQGEITPDEYMKRLGQLPLAYAPGDRFMYSTPSRVTGVLISRVSGMGLGEFMARKIFEPLGMHDTGFWIPEQKRTRLVTYYRPGDGPGALVPTADNNTRYASPPIFPSGSGGLASTVDDYLQFARMLLHQGAVDGVRILSRKSVELMTMDQMPKEPHRRFFIWPDFFEGAGFGFGVELKTERSDLGPSVGSFWWNGATGVAWTADPQEDLVFLRFIQQRSAPAGFAADYTQAVYQAIVD